MRRALEMLIETYQDEVFGYCARLVGTGDALGVYNRVLSAAVSDIDEVHDQRSLRAWLYKIARITVAHHHRSDRRAHPQALDPEYVPVQGPEGGPGVRLSDDRLDDAMAALDPATREILQLALWHRLRLREVAQVVERPLRETRRLAAAGLSRLAFELQQSEEPS